MALDEKDISYLDGKFKEVYDRLNPLCDQVAKNTTHIEWLTWNQRKALGAGIAGTATALVAIGLALWGFG